MLTIFKTKRRGQIIWPVNEPLEGLDLGESVCDLSRPGLEAVVRVIRRDVARRAEGPDNLEVIRIRVGRPDSYVPGGRNASISKVNWCGHLT